MLSSLLSIRVLLISILILASIYGIRFVLLRTFLGKDIFPQLFVAPRGLITVLLFYAIPEEGKVANFEQDIAAKDAQIAELNAQLEAMETRVQEIQTEAMTTGELTSQLTARDVEIERLNSRLVALGERAQSESINAYDAALRRLVASFTQAEEGESAELSIRNGNLAVPNNNLFAAGSADLGSGADPILDPLAESILTLLEDQANADLKLVVIGHADKQPINSSRFPSNWELSAHRAAAVVRGLIDRGVPAENLLAAGQAEFDPIDDADTPEAFATNRRIEIGLQ